MGEKAKNFWNRLWNTAMIVPRTIGTGLNTITDTVDTVVALPKDALDVIKATGHAAKDVLVESRTKWKWYQRVWNVILSPIVATWTVIEWAVRTVVTPVAHWVTNTWNTVRNTVTNTRRSTFGRIFSKKPLSDFSYDKLKTTNFINKDKNWFSWLQFGKKKWVWTPEALKKPAKTAAVAWAAVAWTAVAWKEISELNSKISNLSEENTKIKKQLAEVISANKNLHEENEELKKTLKELIDSLKKDSKTTDKHEDKPAEPKSEKKWDGWKPEKKEGKIDWWKKEWDKWEWKTEKPDEWKKEVKDADRLASISEISNEWKTMINYIKKEHPELKIEFDESTTQWHVKWAKSGNKIIVWTKNKEQVPQILFHEITHVLINDNVSWTKELMSTIKSLNETNWKQLFSVSNNDKYDTNEKKAIEDVCELLALYSRGGWIFEKYMKDLQEWKNDKLAKINESDTNKLKNLCENIISWLKTIKLSIDTPVSMAA